MHRGMVPVFSSVHHEHCANEDPYHADVKPSNILLNSTGQIKICDFGVSGELINSVADTFVGTSTYMSVSRCFPSRVALVRLYSKVGVFAQPERISGDPYTVKSDVWSLGITLVELAIGRFPFSSDDEPPSSDEESDSVAFSKLSLDGVAEEAEDLLAELGDDTLSPTRPAKKRESIMLAEKQRLAKRDAAAARSRKSSTTSNSGGSTKRKSVAGVSLAGSGHQMSILELLQYIVNEPAPKLPSGKFSPQVEEFVNATLRKEPVGYNVKKKGPLPKEVARPTPKELLVSFLDCTSVLTLVF